MNQLTIAWACAGLSYQEDRVGDYIRELFGMKSHWMHDERGSHFYGVVLDEKNGILNIVNRGTDGFDWIGNLMSWWRNARILTGGDGVHNGFQDAGNAVIDNLVKLYIYNFNYVDANGHSQGSGPAAYEVSVLAENFSHIKHSHANIFAYAPCGDERYKRRFDAHKAAGKVSGDGYMNSGDPIGTTMFRNEDSILLDGVDVCEPHILPSIIKYNLYLADVVKHSCKVYNAALIQMYLEREHPEQYLDDILVLGKVGQLLGN